MRTLLFLAGLAAVLLGGMASFLLGATDGKLAVVAAGLVVACLAAPDANEYGGW